MSNTLGTHQPLVYANVNLLVENVNPMNKPEVLLVAS
jgi:hypothetical protein